VSDVTDAVVLAADEEGTDHEEMDTVRVGPLTRPGWVTTTLALAAGEPEVVVNVTVPERDAPVFACAVKVTGRSPVDPAVTKPKPDVGETLTQSGAEASCQVVFEGV